MCAESDAKIRGENVGLYMGYYGCRLGVGDVIYGQDESYSGEARKVEMKKKLRSYTKNELVDLFIDLVDNGGEE